MTAKARPRELQEELADVGGRIAELERANGDLQELLARERRLRRQLEDERAAQDRFLAALSRDLRTPLNAVLGWTQLLRREKLDEGARDRGLATIERNAFAQLRLVEEVLDISRSAGDRAQLERIVVDLRQVVQGAVDRATDEARDRGIELRVTPSANSILVPGDRRRLQQVLANLLSNALKFTPRGGSVTVVLDHDEKAGRVVVTDTGRGIAADAMPTVFAAFRQRTGTDAAAPPADGPGLGLHVARMLAEIHGGSLCAESDGAGRGSRFIVSLPLASGGAVVRSPASHAEPAPSRALPLEGLRVLVLDDDEDSRELTATVLRDRGAVVTLVPDVDAALQAFAAGPPDVIVSDVAMPGRSGLELARQLRAQPIQTTALIALTGFTSPEAVERALDAGFDLHLTKPVEPQHLADAVSDAARLRAR